MKLEYFVISAVVIFILSCFSAYIIKGRMKLRFVSQYWMIYLDFMLYMIFFYLLMIVIIAKFTIQAYNKNSEVSALFFFITIMTFIYVISIGVLLLFIKLFKTDGTFKNSIPIKNSIEFGMIFFPILNTIILFTIYTILIKKKEKVNAAVNEVYS